MLILHQLKRPDLIPLRFAVATNHVAITKLKYTNNIRKEKEKQKANSKYQIVLVTITKTTTATAAHIRTPSTADSTVTAVKLI